MSRGPTEDRRRGAADRAATAEASAAKARADGDRWEQANAGYLSAALTWLRLRLRQAAQERPRRVPRRLEGSPAPSSSPDRARHGWLRRRFDRHGNEVTSRVDASPSEADDTGWTADEPELVSDARVRAAAERMHAASSGELRPALALLSDRFGLSRFEEQVLLLCVALELDTRIGALCARAQGDDGRPFPTFALTISLFEGASWAAMAPDSPLRRWRLIEVSQPPAEPLTTSALRADERVVSFIKGLNYLDERLAPLLVPFDHPGESGEDLPPSQQGAADHVLSYLEKTLGGRSSPVIQLVGADPLSRQLIVRHVAASCRLNLYRMPAELLPQDSAELATLSRLWERESILWPQALFLDLDITERSGGEGTERDSRERVRRFLDRTGGVFFVGTRDVIPRLGAASLAIEARKPLAVEQRAAWRTGPAELGEREAALLAGQFDLNVATIRTVSGLVADAANEKERVARVWRACLDATRPQLDLLAERLDTKADWDDIVLPEEARRLLREIAAQVRARSRVYDEWGFRQKMSRGLGISALFAGESGTGKTMAAEVLARELDLNLYRIDLSAVVSKYIGETEKNLCRLFDAAEDGGAILFFDEADALFGKRSEVKDSHDRYANIEVNYLLQRMEAFEGLAILATNLRSALDRAFLRRLRFIVSFPFPGAAERAEIWKRVFPHDTPVEDFDYAKLSRLDLTGGSIHNVALNASFTAARNGGVVTMSAVLEAARAEFRKMEKPINEADFRWEGPREVA